jgi:hypothetical protein
LTDPFATLPPRLAVTLSGNNIKIAWPATGSYTLQQNSNLTTTNWMASNYSITNFNGSNSITVTPTGGNLFFRLTSP